ncbi:DNA-packaging protein [Pandoraea pnomenusa]|nr:DNA-packaging protein [Pandoraea pnomenusa]
MLFGGSRSGKTFLIVRNIVMRALKAPTSRHLIARFRLNHVKTSIMHGTFPAVMAKEFPGVEYELNKSDMYVTFPNGSEIWFAGLDDKERTEKILGNEYATVYLNECSQIPWYSVGIVITRLAQKVMQVVKGAEDKLLKLRAYFDCNPPDKLHWTYLMFVRKVDIDTKKPVETPEDYVAFKINPHDNAQNLGDGYLDRLKALSSRMRARFLDGKFADANPNALFKEDDIEKWRVLDASELPAMVRVVIAVDPSGADDKDEQSNDAIGIVAAGLGTDGNAYLLEDATVLAGPATWGRVAAQQYDRHEADTFVGETNFGGAMVKFVLQTARPRTPFKMVTASRGKVVRAEPMSALFEQGRVRIVGQMAELEEELCGFSTHGYTGPKSPNRADAAIWALTELFPGVIRQKAEKKPASQPNYNYVPVAGGWMGA